jgi:hypothetical protein
MGDPGLFQELPCIPALLPEGGGDREQSATADGTAGGLDANAFRPLGRSKSVATASAAPPAGSRW